MKKVLAAVLLVPMFVMSVNAQMRGGSSAESFVGKVSALWKKQAFTATVEMQMEGSGERAGEAMKMECLMMVSGDKTRMEMDMSKMMAGPKGGKGAMPPGMEKMISISRMDKKVVYQVMPGMEAYCEMQIPPAAAANAGDAKIDRKPQGTEKIESYSCEKVLNTITTKDGKTQEVMTWEAKDLGGLAIKMEMSAPEGKMTMLFKNIKTDKPADSNFEPPADYTKYNSMQELMMSTMMKGMPR